MNFAARSLYFRVILSVFLIAGTFPYSNSNADFFRAFLPTVSGKSVGTGPAHLIIVGVGNELHDALQKTAITRAFKYRELYPEEPVFLLTHSEEPAENEYFSFTTGEPITPLTNVQKLRNAGFRNVQQFKNVFSDRKVLAEIRSFTQIRSLDFYSHNSPHYGIQLESNAYRLAPTSQGLESLASLFTEDAFGFIHGCNSGWIVATEFSKKMGIPFAGSFASTDFEFLNSDGQFYQRTAGQFPATHFPRRNAVSFKTRKSCAFGGCIRMKPNNTPYNGTWGNLENGGLNAYKFFCPGIAENRCLIAMATSLFSFPSIRPLGLESPVDEYREVLVDFLCPVQEKGKFRKDCRADLEHYARVGERLNKVFPTPEVQCDFNGCQAEPVCKRNRDGGYIHGTCKVENASLAPVTTVNEEYLYYLKGFELFRARNPVVELVPDGLPVPPAPGTPQG